MSQNEALTQRLLTAEQGVLGSMLIDGETVGPMLLAVREDDFQAAENRNIFRAFRELYGQGRSPDPILVNEHLGGGYGEYLTDLMNVTPTAANAEEYAGLLKEASRLWRLRAIGEQLAQAESLDGARALSDRASLLLCEQGTVRKVDMKRGLQEFFLRHGGEKRKDFISWGFSWLDERLHVSEGDMVVIGGLASSGKTALALQLAFHIAKKRRVGFFSYETGKDKLMDRTVTCQTLVSYGKIMKDQLEHADLKQVYEMRQYIQEPQLEYLETGGWTVSDIGSYAMAQHYDVIVVDYLQKIPAARSGRALSEYERVSQVSSDLQQLGRRTGKVIIALSQLSRHEGAPTLSNLRQSGQIEQDADAVMLLYRQFPDDPQKQQRNLEIPKNKDGVAGIGFTLDFDGDNQRFRQSNAQWAPEKKKEAPAQTSIFRPLPGTGPTPFDGKAERSTSP